MLKGAHCTRGSRCCYTIKATWNDRWVFNFLPGLKGETWETIIETAIAVVKLQPDFVRIYPVLVIENTELARTI